MQPKPDLTTDKPSGEKAGDKASDKAPAPGPEGGAPTPATQSGETPESAVREIGGREGPEPTRYGDWEKNGRCIDF
ncbi:MAG: DUF1674 domain-containing protein [Gammaproteobacteria bacterium]